MIDVDNPEERLRPGMTASVVLSGVRHDGVTRIPNAAVSFRPPVVAFSALNQTEPAVPAPSFTVANGEKPRELWTYDGHQLTPVMADLGLSDAQWTEVVKGPFHPGDRIVTNAVIKKASQ